MLNALIVVVSRGGALPVLLGLLGALFCLQAARNGSMSTGKKVGLCILITIVAWLLLALLIGGILLTYLNW